MEKSRFPKQCGKFFSPKITEYFILLTGNILFWALILPRVKHPFCSCGKNGWGGAQPYQRPSGTKYSNIFKWKGPKGKISTNTKIPLLVVLGVFLIAMEYAAVVLQLYILQYVLQLLWFVTDFVLLKFLTATWECFKQSDTAIFYRLVCIQELNLGFFCYWTNKVDIHY